MNAIWAYLTANRAQIQDWTVTTFWLAAAPVGIGLLLALPCGVAAHRHRALRTLVVSGAGVLYTVPSLVMFLVVPEVLGTRILDPRNVVAALSLYSFALLVRGVLDGLDSVPGTTLATGRALGHTPRQLLLSVQLPLALPVITAGLRVAAVSNVSLVPVASVIGTPQLGQLFILGDDTGALPPVVLGLLLFAVIALAFDLALVATGRLLTPWRTAAGR